MLKAGKKLLSIWLCAAILVAGMGIIPFRAAAVDGRIVLSDCSSFAGAALGTAVPDGRGLKVSTTVTVTQNSNNIKSGNSFEFTKSSLEKGAFIIYFGHDKQRTLDDETTETAYAENLFMFRFLNSSSVKQDIYIDGKSGAKTVYYISSADGTVIENQTTTVSTGIAVGDNGKYYNEGYYVIPGAALQTSLLSEEESYTLDLLKCNPRNTTNPSSSTYPKAACNFYYDNLVFAEDITDVLGADTNDGYAYRGGDIYPVYELGYMTGRTNNAPKFKVSSGSITLSGLEGSTRINIYRNGKYLTGATTDDDTYTFSSLKMGSYSIQTAQLAQDGSFTAASMIADTDVISASRLKVLRGYDHLIKYDPETGKGNGTSDVLDGSGFMGHTTEAMHENSFSHTVDSAVQMTADLAQNGALVFYYKHDSVRTVNSVEQSAFATLLPKISLDKNGTKTTLSINAQSEKQTVYFIAANDGTVIRNSTHNVSVLSAKAADGTYYNEGYWVIPLSAFTNGFADDISEYTLTEVACIYRNTVSASNLSVQKAACAHYFDNITYAEDIEDVLGALVSGEKGTPSAVYTYDAQTQYPVYTLGFLKSSPDKTLKKNSNILRNKDFITIAYETADTAILNVYDENGIFMYSSELSPNGNTFVLQTDNSQSLKLQLIIGNDVFSPVSVNRAGDIKDDGKIDLLDFVALKKLLASGANGKYNSDINGSGATDSMDAILLVRMLLGADTYDIDTFETEALPLYTYDAANYPSYNYGVSDLYASETLKYLYEGNGYVYGITRLNTEKIALIDRYTNKWINVSEGAGTAVLKAEDGTVLAQKSSIEGFEATKNGEYDALRVRYKLSGSDALGASLVNTYTFKENSISVSQNIVFSSDTNAASSEKSYIERNIYLACTADEPTVVGKWIYHENGDYPYQVSESVATVLKFDANHSLYTFVKCNSDNEKVYPETYPQKNLPLSFEGSSNVNHTVEYDIVPYTAVGDITDNYYAMFGGRGSDYAAGVFAAQENTENSTVFVGNSVDLKINLSNLIDRDIFVDLKYTVYDYSGRLVDEGIFNNYNVKKGISLNRGIRVSGDYGMYYLNLTVSSDKYTHTECYPFALIETSDYQYRSTNPFGISSIADNGAEKDALTAASLALKIGTGNFRVIANAKGYQMKTAELLAKGGVKINAQLNMNNVKSGSENITSEELSAAVEQYLPSLSQITEDIEVGNEIAYQYNDSSEYADRYINEMYMPIGELVKSYGFKYLGSGELCSEKWLNDVLGQSKAVWDKSDVLSVHAYGTTKMPDIYGGKNSNYESELMRVKQALQNNGQKEWYITEMGYPASPERSELISIRTQADYNIRSLILGSSYGASRVQLYSFYDRISYGNGYDGYDAEMNYGMFYQPDFLGVVKPKPAAAAFAAINHITDGLISTEEYSKYTRADGTLRAFKFNMSNGTDLYAVWSNKYPLSEAFGNEESRAFSMPWSNQWKGKTEEVTFNTSADTVTVTDIMGNITAYTAENGKVTIPVSGSPLYIKGIN